MARRLFNGRKFSEDGWPYVDEGSCTWVVVPGTNPPVHLQIQNGPPLSLLRAWAADWNAYIEPLRDADSACWTPGNSVATSNHPGGTAIDLNWDSHDFQVRGTLNAAQMSVMAEMEAFYEGNVFWAGRWKSPVDEMHSQCGYDTYDQNADRPFPKVLDFIARKIRPDGFSTFRRGGAPGVPAQPPVVEPAQPALAIGVLSRATGVSAAKAQEILVGVVNGLRDSQCNNVNRIAMWLAQIGHESAGFNATEEYQNGDESTDRWKYKGRTWIQITWKSNYAGLSQWAFGKGLIPTPTYFVDNPRKLAEIQYAGLGPAWYWTVARPQINGLCDARNLVAVTQAINGGQNGAADRKNRYDRALALGDQLLVLTSAPPPQGDDDLSAEAERMISEMYSEWRKEKKGPSRSFLATDGTGVESPLGFLYNIDGNVWTQQLTWAYLFDVPLALEVVEAVAQNGSYTGSWVASNGFNAWLNEFGQAYCQGLVNFKKALVVKLSPSAQPKQVATVAYDAPATGVDTGPLEAEIARLSEQFEQLRVAVTNPPAPPANGAEVVAGTTAQRIGNLVGAVKDGVELGLSMDQTERAALTAASRILQLENGSNE